MLMLPDEVDALIEGRTIPHHEYRDGFRWPCITLALQERGAILQMGVAVGQSINIVIEESPAGSEQVKLVLYLTDELIQLGRVIVTEREIGSRPKRPLAM
ncbi:hypothetical protein D3C76_1266730 [compost metagenome]